MHRVGAFALAAALLALSACTPATARGDFAVDVADCTDAALVFARGSSNDVGAGSARMLEELFVDALGELDPTLSTRFVELGDLDGDGVLDEGGYPAPGFAGYFGIDTIGDPERELFLIGAYNESTRLGGDELVAVIAAMHSMCPDQAVVVVGESQGADAAMKGLARMPAPYLASIAAVHVFGDPGLVVGPWMVGAGTSVPSGHGILGPRVPYVPEVLEGRTTSWCGRFDGLCTGQIWFSILDAVDECDEHAELPICSRRHVDYDLWAFGPAMRQAAGSVTAVR
ncbi:MAG: cutinase family protein [Actinomycetia bacterium]|nr:cutinase family protein [Actinomycetes bacterium]